MVVLGPCLKGLAEEEVDNLCQPLEDVERESFGHGGHELGLVECSNPASLEPIRNQVLEKIIPSGWSQLLSTPTRHQRGQTPALLDHIYQRGDLEVPRRFNRNLIGTDHNLVGARVSLKKPVFQPQFIKTWNENCFTKFSNFMEDFKFDVDLHNEEGEKERQDEEGQDHHEEEGDEV